MVLSLPWIFVSFLFYNAIVLYHSFSDKVGQDLTTAVQDTLEKTTILSIPLVSGVSWKMSLGDLVLVTAVLALFVEILKATQTRSLAILDHGLSVVVFIICLIEFLTLKSAATSVFFFITLLSLIDVIAGFSVGIRAARRDFNIPSAG